MTRPKIKLLSWTGDQLVADDHSHRAKSEAAHAENCLKALMASFHIKIYSSGAPGDVPRGRLQDKGGSLSLRAVQKSSDLKFLNHLKSLIPGKKQVATVTPQKLRLPLKQKHAQTNCLGTRSNSPKPSQLQFMQVSAPDP